MRFNSEKIAVVLGRSVDALGSLIFLKMLAIAVTKDNVGTYLLASSFLAVLLTMTFSAWDQGLLRNLSDYRDRAELSARYSAMLLGYLAIGFVLALIIYFGVIGLGIFSSLQLVWVPLLLWFVSDGLKNLNQTVASGLRSRQLITFASAIDYGCRISFLAWFGMYQMADASTVIYLLVLSGLAATMVYLVAHRGMLTYFSWPNFRGTLLESLVFSWPMIIWGLFAWIQNMSNRWILSHFTNLGVVAEYGVLVSIASFPVTALLGIVVTYIVPILYEQENLRVGASRAIVLRAALAMLPVCAVLILIAIFWHRDIILLFSGPEYIAHSAMLPIVVAAVSFNAACSVLIYSVLAQRQVSSLLFANILPGVICLILGYYLIQLYGFEGAIWTLGLTQILGGVLFVLTYLFKKPVQTVA
jgi:O-antigen/teichoic acid export membrane protein